MVLVHIYVQKFWYTPFDRQTDPSPFRVLEPTCFFLQNRPPSGLKFHGLSFGLSGPKMPFDCQTEPPPFRKQLTIGLLQLFKT